MGKRLKEIDLYQVYLKWYQGSGVFRCFFRTTNFVSLKHYPDFYLDQGSLDENLNEKILKIIDRYDVHTSLFFLDLPCEQAISPAYFLQANKSIKPILTFNNVLHPYGLIGTREYISRLILYSDYLEEVEPKGFIFILDNLRFGDYDDKTLRSNFNNQYELTEYDLPYLEMLRELGFERVIYISNGKIKEDI
ncbi:MAG TPA: hypothetical protein VF941_13510 [Clostridia bacterium]